MTTLAQTTLSLALPRTWNQNTRRILTTVLLCITGISLLTLSSKISLPSYPVPMTMQTFVVLMIGLTFGARLSASTLIGYLSLGAMGLPVFAGTPEKGIGLAYMAGATGGYLVGFLLATIVMGFLAEKLKWERKMSTTFLAMLIGVSIIYASGLLGLGILLGFDKPLFSMGAAPFLFGEGIKMAMVVLIVPFAWKCVQKAKS